MKSHLDKFDFLRGIAIILVVCYHSMQALFGNYEIPIHDSFFVNFSSVSSRQVFLNLFPFAFGNSGVVLFLTISGFLIHYNYLVKEQPFSAPLFFNKRFWRIYPPYVIALTIFCLLFGLNSILDLVFHLLLIHNARYAYIYSINPSFWSLALEMQLYLIYPIYLYLYNKFGNNKSFLITVFVSLLFVIVRFVFKIEKHVFYTSVFSYWMTWTIGAYLAHIFKHGKRLSNISFTTLLLLLIPLFAIRLSIIHQYFWPYLFAVYFALLIDCLLHSNFKPSKASRTIEVTGLCSYSIYLFHQPVLSYLKDNIFTQQPFSMISKIVMLFFVCLVIGILSYINYRTIEIGSIKMGSRFYKKYLNK